MLILIIECYNHFSSYFLATSSSKFAVLCCAVLFFSILPFQIAILMELSQTLRCTKECSGTSGSESGWTSYIASPIKENNSDDDSDDKQGDCRKGNYESDDSMASDASSGPSHPELPCRINEGSINIGPFKHATTTYLSKKKLHRQVKRGDGTRTTVEKEVPVLIKASSAASHDHVQSGTKVRKSTS